MCFVAFRKVIWVGIDEFWTAITLSRYFGRDDERRKHLPRRVPTNNSLWPFPRKMASGSCHLLDLSRFWNCPHQDECVSTQRAGLLLDLTPEWCNRTRRGKRKTTYRDGGLPPVKLPDSADAKQTSHWGLGPEVRQETMNDSVPRER